MCVPCHHSQGALLFEGRPQGYLHPAWAVRSLWDPVLAEELGCCELWAPPSCPRSSQEAYVSGWWWPSRLVASCGSGRAGHPSWHRVSSPQHSEHLGTQEGLRFLSSLCFQVGSGAHGEEKNKTRKTDGLLCRDSMYTRCGFCK